MIGKGLNEYSIFLNDLKYPPDFKLLLPACGKDTPSDRFSDINVKTDRDNKYWSSGKIFSFSSVGRIEDGSERAGLWQAKPKANKISNTIRLVPYFLFLCILWQKMKLGFRIYSLHFPPGGTICEIATLSSSVSGLGYSICQKNLHLWLLYRFVACAPCQCIAFWYDNSWNALISGACNPGAAAARGYYYSTPPGF